ncbi:hypothetical protein CQA53_06825 [Helicobacter didelphidarum]|uniref:Uncharacterized protein n=1 Tax=Helicobacter didelphidarum TaxID=2040648 RepID=A0A3D8IJ85_9HELI|nr:hypothetical protein [Helicobacter didelphidarum]RDU65279.1 hypothetical protein CQA53_06825 [Helicobacter didelphidarum]
MKTSVLKKSLLDYAIKGQLTARFRRENPTLSAFDEIQAYNDEILFKRKELEKELKALESVLKDSKKSKTLSKETQMMDSSASPQNDEAIPCHTERSEVSINNKQNLKAQIQSPLSPLKENGDSINDKATLKAKINELKKELAKCKTIEILNPHTDISPCHTKHSEVSLDTESPLRHCEERSDEAIHNTNNKNKVDCYEAKASRNDKEINCHTEHSEVSRDTKSNHRLSESLAEVSINTNYTESLTTKRKRFILSPLPLAQKEKVAPFSFCNQGESLAYSDSSTQAEAGHYCPPFSACPHHESGEKDNTESPLCHCERSEASACSYECETRSKIHNTNNIDCHEAKASHNEDFLCYTESLESKKSQTMDSSVATLLQNDDTLPCHTDTTSHYSDTSSCHTEHSEVSILNQSHEVQPLQSRLFRGAEKEKQGGSSATALLELEAERARLSPDCKKAATFFG